MPTQGEIEEARSKVGMEYVELDDREQTIRFTREGVELSPASMGKGFALDSALQIAQRKGLETVLMHGGHSSVLASGAPAWRSAWQIDVRNPLDHESPLATAVTQPGFPPRVMLQHFEYEAALRTHNRRAASGGDGGGGECHRSDCSGSRRFSTAFS